MTNVTFVPARDAGLQVDIVSVETEIYSGTASFVVLPGEAGELGVYPGHVPLLTRIKPGVVSIWDGGSEPVHRVFVAGGVAEALRERVTVLADHALRTPELDAARASDARRQAAVLRARYPSQPAHTFDFAAAKTELADELRRFFLLAFRKPKH
ncbi:ATP synthase F1 subunit epsilon [Trinickia dabaoshanensis]|uniref:ATP synthase epsilon chain n=1 Tax=Trinickia dabaoshanensis TaxID=564714 RepID=A0A2N7VBX4_9BURK|nr:ATP synthase F1 subunit epsilon [Trinickia dabaoshanensis]PMS14671.1 ATP synthase F1 subunit epsilon [Trinickia dabaoshanensis]